MARMSRLGILRLTFLGLAGLLLLPLYALKGAIDARIAAQARLRHEVVAERIFDEFERELTHVVERETTRPSSAYDSPTDPATWAPFVTGYYVVNRQGVRLTVRDQSTAQSRDAIRARLERMRAAPEIGPAPTDPADSELLDQIKSATESPNKELPSRSSPAVLRQLNVGSLQRKAAARPASKKSMDPLQDYAY